MTDFITAYAMKRRNSAKPNSQAASAPSASNEESNDIDLIQDIIARRKERMGSKQDIFPEEELDDLELDPLPEIESPDQLKKDRLKRILG